MKRRAKTLYLVSIGLNIILIGFIGWEIFKMNFVKEQVLATEVQYNLVELERLITKQMEDHWSEPNLVTTELGSVLNGILLGINTGEQLGTLSKNDKQILSHLYSSLNQYPQDHVYQFSELTDEDKENFEELQQILRDAGLGMNMTISTDMDTFMEQFEEVTDTIPVPIKGE